MGDRRSGGGGQAGARAAWGPGEGGDLLPVLRTGDLVLRGFCHDDVDLVLEASDDPLIPLVTTVPARCTRAQAESFVERQRHRLRDGFGYSFVIAKAPPAGAGAPGGVARHPPGRGIGSIGLWLRDIDQGRASVGYWVVASGRGRGAAGGALAALSSWALDERAIPRLELHVEPWNTPSIRTAEAAGFRREGLLRSWQQVGGERRDMYVYSLLATDRA